MYLENFTGVYREYYDEEKYILNSEVFMLNGKKEGMYKSYYKNGQLMNEINYIDDKKEGIYKSYFLNGQLMVETNYINDKRNGYK